MNNADVDARRTTGCGLGENVSADIVSFPTKLLIDTQTGIAGHELVMLAGVMRSNPEAFRDFDQVEKLALVLEIANRELEQLMKERNHFHQKAELAERLAKSAMEVAEQGRHNDLVGQVLHDGIDVGFIQDTNGSVSEGVAVAALQDLARRYGVVDVTAADVAEAMLKKEATLIADTERRERWFLGFRLRSDWENDLASGGYLKGLPENLHGIQGLYAASS